MSLAEIACRGRHEASKWIERLALRRAAADPRRLLENRAPGLAEPDMALRVLRERAPGRFFAGAADRAALDALHARRPHDCCDLVAAATDVLISQRFDLLGYRKLTFGDPIDWHLDPVWTTRAPLVHWGRIDPLDPEQVGDSKIVWELNRHQWMVGLAQAWALTGDERYGIACLETIERWHEANPPGIGINWASSLEVALRLMSWCWTLLLLRDLPTLAAAGRLAGVLAAVWQHAAHIRRHLSRYFSPNTHLTAEALGLFYAGTLFTEFADAARWRELGSRILVAESARQISSDGVYFEQSTCYQRYTIEIYLHFLLLADRNGIPVPERVRQHVERMVDFLIAVRQPDGSIPAIGDADGGTLLPLAPRRSHDGRGLFAAAAVMFGRPAFAWAAEGQAPEVAWLFGREGLDAFDAVRPAPPGGTSQAFPVGGYAVMRSGWDRRAHQMIVDAGPLGCEISSGHGHADLLGIQCAIFGEPCLVDPGTYCYTTEPQWRDYFRSTAAHSTVQLDGAGQSVPAGPFRWTRRPRVRLRAWQSTPAFDLVDAESNAFIDRPDPVVHRRRVLFVKPRYWIVVDDLAGRSAHRVELAFQFAPLQVELDSDGWVHAHTNGGGTLRVFASASSPLHATLRLGELLPIRGWVSPDYGQRLAAPAAIYSCDALLPWRAVTLLLPDREGAAAPPAVEVIRDHTGFPAGLRFERSGDAVRIDEKTIYLDQCGRERR
jgi:hypothetical protein